MITFLYPYAIILLFLPFILRAIFPLAKNHQGAAIKIPFIKDLKKIQHMSAQSVLSQRGQVSDFLRLFFLFLLWFLIVLALMRPIQLLDPVRFESKGRDILMITDISTSMLEEDFKYQTRRISRLDAVKAVVSDFTKKRLNDRMGLILFGTRAYLQAPLTFDKVAIVDILSLMKAGMAGQSTAIGDALGLGLKTLKEAKTNKNNQVIILLTDGENNDGSMSLPEAIHLSKTQDVKIYTIGVGSPAFSIASAFFGVQNSNLDEKSLKELASQTKGQYFKVTSLNQLIAVYKKIDALEEQNFDQNYIYPQKELYFIPLLLALVLTLVALLFERLKKVS